MNKLNSFYKSNKPFVVVASVFVLVVCIFNYRAINLYIQSAQVISIDSGAAPFNQYPALSNSGFYLETAVNSGGFPQAMAETQSVMSDTAKNVKTLLSDYFNSGCNSSLSTGVTSSGAVMMPGASLNMCSTKRVTILNSLYTYSTYATSYYKLKYESAHGVLNNSTIDWAGISASSLYGLLTSPTTANPSVDNLLSDISNKISLTVAMSIPRGKFGPNNSVYTPPLQSDMDSLLNKLLKADMKYLLADVTVPHVALFSKEQNMASVASILGSSKTALMPTINTFTINGTTGTTVDQGSSLTISWSASNVSACSATGGVGTGWNKSTSTAISGTLNTTMSSITSQTFTLTCTTASGYATKSVTVGVNPAKVVPTTAVPTTPTTITAPVTTTQTTTLTPSNTTSGAVTIPSSNVTSGALVGPKNVTVSTSSALTPTGNDNSLVTIDSTSSTPFVGPLPENPYVSPYLFVFGPNSLGNIDFKIMNKASAGTVSSRFAQVNGSVGETSLTMTKLGEIGGRVSAEKLAAANFSVKVDSTILEPITCDPNAGNYSSAAGDDSAGTDCSDLNMVKITTPLELSVVNTKIGFFASEYKTNFISITNSLNTGDTFDLFFSKTKDDQSVGVVDNNFLQSNTIQNSSSCSTVMPVKSLNVPTNITKSTTPILDKFKGMCGPLATVRSLVTTLKLPLPKGYPSPTYNAVDYNNTTAWNKDFIEHALEQAGAGAGATGGFNQSQYLKLYKSYAGSSMNVTEYLFNPDLSPIEINSQNQISSMLKDGKTDCRLNTLAHSSHISKVYFSNNGKTFNIQVDDSLDQGSLSKASSDQYLMAPFYPGQTTFQLDNNGLVKKILNGGYPFNGWFTQSAIGYWNDKINFTKEFFVDCFVISSK